MADVEALGWMISLVLRNGVAPKEVTNQLKEIGGSIVDGHVVYER